MIARIGLMGLLLALLPWVARADTVYFLSNTTLECKVIGETADGILVELGNDAKGSMLLDPKKIKRIEYDFDSRLEALETLDEEAGTINYRAHYDLGVWCVEQGPFDPDMYKRALDRLQFSQGKEGVPDEALLHLARTYEKIEPPDPHRALQNYKLYLAKHPDHAETQAAVKRLEAAAPQPIKVAPKGPKEGLEVRPWRWQSWSNKGTMRLVTDNSNGNSKTLELKFKPGKQDKTAFMVNMGKDRNLSKKEALTLDFLNPGKKSVQVAVAVVTGTDFEWFESQPVSIKPGAWSLGIQFRLTEKRWKSKKTGWRYRTEPKNLSNARSICVLIYNKGGKGTLYVDSVAFSDPAPVE